MNEAHRSSARKPDLFLVGAAKSGTTSMESYLSLHPEIFMSARSEVHHFGRDLTIRFRVDDPEEYLVLFADAGNAVAVGEKSIGYLFSDTAAREIFDFNPDARIVIMLRNPSEMLFSLHRQFVRSGNEDLVDIREAINAQADRLAGNRLPPTCHKPDMLQYFDVVMYTPQVRRYLDAFGDRVIILLFDDLKEDPAKAYRRVLHAVGADPGFLPEFEIHNPTIDLPSVALRNQMAKHPGVAGLVRKVVTPTFRRRMRRASARFQDQPARRLDSELRRELADRFEPDIEELAGLIGRDLSPWLRR